MMVTIGSLKVGQIGRTREGRALLRIRAGEQNAAVDLENPSIVLIWEHNSISTEVEPLLDNEFYYLQSKPIPGK